MNDAADTTASQLLLHEYDTVHRHFMFATQQKGVVFRLWATLATALLASWAATFLSKADFAFALCSVTALFVFVYAQKEAEYWIAFLCLERLESRLNRIVGESALSYTSFYKRQLFPRHDRRVGAVSIMQWVRILPIAALVIFCAAALIEESQFVKLAVSMIPLALSGIYLGWARYGLPHRVLKATGDDKPRLS